MRPDGDGGIIERPERLVIVLVGAALSGVPFLHMPWLLEVAAWILAVASVVTVAQRLQAVRVSPGAMDPLEPTQPEGPDKSESSEP